MYNIADLNAMDEAQLKSIAESMGIKKVDALQQEDLVYKILDQQAIDLAAASTVGKKRRAPKEPKQNSKAQEKTDGRKKKKAQAEPAPETEAAADAQEPQQEEKLPDAPKTEAPRRKRGRPAKEPKAAVAPKNDRSEAEAEVPVENLPEKEQPMLPAAPVEDGHREEMTMVSPLPMLPEAEKNAVEDNGGEAPAGSERPAAEAENSDGEADGKPKRDFRPGAIKDATFGAFFRSDKKFVPRSQREKEEAAMAAAKAAATAPIILKEPGQEPAPQQQHQGKKNKRNRNNNNNNQQAQAQQSDQSSRL